MAIFYTNCEGGNIQPLPIKSMHQKIAKQLYRHRQKRKENEDFVSNRFGGEFSHIKVAGVRYPYKVHSVFFCKGRKVMRIWDAHFNGYRPKKFTKGLIIPKSVGKI